MRVSNVVLESLLYIHELLVLYFSGKVENLVRITPVADLPLWTVFDGQHQHKQYVYNSLYSV